LSIRKKVWKLRDAGKSIRFIERRLKLSHGTVQRVVAARESSAVREH
jgi:hypothetical protein